MIASDDFVPFGSFLYRKLADALASVWKQYCCFDALLAALTHIKALVIPGYPSGCSISYWVSIDDLKIWGQSHLNFTHGDPTADGHGPLTCHVIRIRLVSTAASVELQRVLRSEDPCLTQHHPAAEAPSFWCLKWFFGPIHDSSMAHFPYQVETSNLWHWLTLNKMICEREMAEPAIKMHSLSVITDRVTVWLSVRVNWQPAQKLFVPCGFQPGGHWLLPGRRCA